MYEIIVRINNNVHGIIRVMHLINTSVCQVMAQPVIFATQPVIFATQPVIFATQPVIFATQQPNANLSACDGLVNMCSQYLSHTCS